MYLGHSSPSSLKEVVLSLPFDWHVCQFGCLIVLEHLVTMTKHPSWSSLLCKSVSVYVYLYVYVCTYVYAVGVYSSIECIWGWDAPASHCVWSHEHIMKKCKGDFRGCGVQLSVCVCVSSDGRKTQCNFIWSVLPWRPDYTYLEVENESLLLGFPTACFPCDLCCLSFLGLLGRIDWELLIYSVEIRSCLWSCFTGLSLARLPS